MPGGVSVFKRQMVTGDFSLEAVIDTMSQHMEVQINSMSLKGQQFKSLVSVLPEMIAPKMLDDLPQWDGNDMFDGNSFSEVIWDRKVADELLDGRNVKEVIWDDVVLHGPNTFDQAVCVERAVSKPTDDAAYSVLEEVPLGNVNWDAMSTEPIKHEGLLQQLPQGTEEEMHCEQVPCVDVVWDEHLLPE